MNKVKTQTERYPVKRGYAIGKLQKFLKLSNLTNKFRANCRFQKIEKGQTDLTSIEWSKANEGPQFWWQVNKDFTAYCNGEKVFNTYED